MRCQSVACLWWRGAPPLHRVTASAALNRPPTLYTGGSDGSIIWWNLSNDQKASKPIRAREFLSLFFIFLFICRGLFCDFHGSLTKQRNAVIREQTRNGRLGEIWLMRVFATWVCLEIWKLRVSLFLVYGSVWNLENWAGVAWFGHNYWGFIRSDNLIYL